MRQTSHCHANYHCRYLLLAPLSVRHMKGFSMVTVILHLALVAVVVLAMARKSSVEEKISQSHDAVNTAYVHARGEVFNQSTSDTLKVSVLAKAIMDRSTEVAVNSPEHLSLINYKNDYGRVVGYSLDGFKGHQFDIVTENESVTRGSFNKQTMGVVYVATKD